MPAQAVKAVSDLLDDRSYHIEFNGHLTNHVKHAVIALAGIGAPEQVIREYHTSYCRLTPYGFPLEPARAPTTPINVGNWREYLGNRAHFAAYCAFFDDEVARKGISGAVDEYAPYLLRGWIGAFTHATIHLGWAIWAEHPAMTAESLAYLAFSFVPVLAEDRAARPAVATAEPWESLLHLASGWERDPVFRGRVDTVVTDTNSFTDLHPELSRSGLQARVAGVARADIPELADAPGWLRTLSDTERRDQVRHAVTLLYLAVPGDFVVLHLITSLFALETILDKITAKSAADTVYDLYWAGLRIIAAAEGKVPTAQKLRDLDALYVEPASDHSGYAADEFDVIARRAWLEDEEHNPKLVFVLRSWWEEDPWTGYRHAAAQFTSTPDLPPSFEEPPNE
ncbi:questin oxidase family protein [Nocardia sp. NBC_01499]|uniref:questin oxidase family protein n=1 Tax=Nocardia sp. NBC_01499 TaxID=2903597 RepID=UPI00386B2D89